MRRRHRCAFGERIVGLARLEIPHRRSHSIGRVAESKVAARSPNADVGPEVRVRGRGAVRADGRDGEHFRICGRIEKVGRAVVARGRYDQGAGAGRADDRVVQRRVVPRSAEAQVDDPGARARLHRPAHAVVGRQARCVQNALSDVIRFTETSGAESADWADAYRPVHTAHAEPVVAAGSDRAGDVQAMTAEGVGKEAPPRRVQTVGRRISRVRVVAIAVSGITDGAARAQPQRVDVAHEVISIFGQVSRDPGMVEANPIVHDGDQHRGAPRGDGPRARQVDHAVVPGLKRVERIVGSRARRRPPRRRRAGHPARAGELLIEPDEAIAADAGDGRIATEGGRDGIQLHGVHHVDPGRQNGRRYTDNVGRGGHHGGKALVNRRAERVRRRCPPENRSPQPGRAEGARPESHDQVARRSDGMRPLAANTGRRRPSHGQHGHRSRQGRCRQGAPAGERGEGNARRCRRRRGYRDSAADGPVVRNPARRAVVPATMSQSDREHPSECRSHDRPHGTSSVRVQRRKMLPGETTAGEKQGPAIGLARELAFTTQREPRRPEHGGWP